MYQKRKGVRPALHDRYCVSIFLCGAWFGYHYAFLKNAVRVLVFAISASPFQPVLMIDEWTSFFFSIILGLGICFELPILIFFLALFGIVDAKFLLCPFRYAILEHLHRSPPASGPMQDPLSNVHLRQPHACSCTSLGVAIAWYVHPNRRKTRKDAPAV